MNAGLKNKEFPIPTSPSTIEASVKKILTAVLSDQQAGTLSQSIAQGAGKFVAAGNPAACRDALRTLVKEKGFAPTDPFLDKIMECCQNKNLTLRLVDIGEWEGQFQRLVNDLPERSAAVIVHGVPKDKLIGIVGEEPGQEPYLMAVVAELGEFIWNINGPSECQLADGTIFDEFQLDEMMAPVMKELLGGELKQRGIANVIGPKGGEHCCGEVLSKKRNDQKDLKVDLENKYSVKLFS